MNLALNLQQKAAAIAAQADMILEKTNDWQVIKAFLSNRVKDLELTSQQQQKLDRYQYIYNQLVSGKYTDQEVVHQAMKQFNIKLSQAYEDMAASKEIFNTTININKNFELMVQLQINRKMLHKAQDMDDLKAYAALEKNRALLIKQLPEEDESPGEFFEGHTYELTFDPAIIGAPAVDMRKVLNAINSKRGKKINVDMFDQAEIVEDDDQ